MLSRRYSASELVSELKSRGVVRVAVGYLVASWLVIQVAVNTFPYLNLPVWAITAVILLSILGLPIALFLSWAFDLTSAGVRRTQTVAQATTAPVPLKPKQPRKRTEPVGELPDAVVSTEVHSVAVLPFANMSADPDNEYFADGMTEDTLTQLARIPDLHVISRTSVMPYKQTDKSVATIGAELGATHILEGSVRRSGDRVRIAAQLIDARTDEHLWAEHYDREFSDVFAIQSDIAHQIASALQAKLGRAVWATLRVAPTRNLEAYDLYLRARDYHNRRRSHDNQIAIELAHRIIEMDPSFPDAYTLLGNAFMTRVNQFGGGGELLDSAKEMAEHALTLDPDHDGAHVLLGSIYSNKGQFADAEASLKRAAELNSSNGGVVMNLGILSATTTGRVDDALKWFRTALRVEPGRADEIYYNMAVAYADIGLLKQAGTACQSSLALRPDFPRARELSVDLALRGGELDRAIREIQDLIATDPTDERIRMHAVEAFLFKDDLAEAQRILEAGYRLSPVTCGTYAYAPVLLGYVYWEVGDREGARALFREFDAFAAEEAARSNRSYDLLLNKAFVCSIEGNRSEGLHRLHEAVAAGFCDAWLLAQYPLLAGLRSEDEFLRILAGVNARAEAMRRRVEREGW